MNLRKRTSILLADDANLYRMTVAKELESTGLFNVYQASSESELLRMIKTHRPEVVIFDSYLATGTIRGLILSILNWSFKTKVIVLSFDIFEELIKDCIDAGAKGFLDKGGEIDFLIGSVSKISQGESVISRRKPKSYSSKIAFQYKVQ